MTATHYALIKYDRVEIVASLRSAIDHVERAFSDATGRQDHARCADLRQAIAQAERAKVWLADSLAQLQKREAG